MKSLKERIEIEQAKLDGEEIEWSFLHKNNDWTLHPHDVFDWETFDFRIKPEPMEFWVNIYAQEISYCCYPSKEEAIKSRSSASVKTIKVREVL